ncbi:MAG: glycosyltransferase [Ferruginibacter sp.]
MVITLFYEDDQLTTIQYEHNEVSVIGVVTKDETKKEIYRKFRKEWVQSWYAVLEKMAIEEWDLLHIHANTSSVGEALIKAVKLNSSRVKIVASYHLPVSCSKGTLLFANTMHGCEVKPAINICTACFISSKQQWPLGIAKVISAFMPMPSSEKLPTALRIKYLVKQFIRSFDLFNKEVSLWHVFSQQIKSILLLNGVEEKKIFLLKHGVNRFFFEDGDQASLKRLLSSCTIFIYAARFDRAKGFGTLLKAWCNLPDSKDRNLWIIGEQQTDDEQITDCIQQASVRNDITWLGAKSQEELSLIMKEAHCVIIPSECEEIGPLVFHESISAGCDVIASDIGGCRELAGIYDKKTGVFEPGNVARLLEMIQQFKYSGLKEVPLSQTQNYQLVLASYTQLVQS